MGKETTTLQQMDNWKEYPEPTRSWPTPLPLVEINDAVNELEINPRILSVGCGSGTNLTEMGIRHSGANIIGIDINLETLKEAYKRIHAEGLEHRIDVLQGNFAQPPFPNKKFDIIEFTGFLTNSIDLRKVFKKARELLTKRGSIVISDYAGLFFSQQREQRYLRSTKALVESGMLTPKEAMWTLIIRPSGYPAKRVLELDVEDLKRALEQGEYDRIVRHLPSARVEEILSEVGFKTESMSREELYENQPFERIVNYKLRATLV